MNKKLDLHISDTLNKLDLKIYEETIDDKVVFTFNFHNLIDNSKIILKLEEKVAALLFEGLNQIFVEDDTEYQRDEPSPSPSNPQEISFKNLENFFESLKGYDKKYFSSNDEDDEDDENY